MDNSIVIYIVMIYSTGVLGYKEYLAKRQDQLVSIRKEREETKVLVSKIKDDLSKNSEKRK